ncbi:MAG: YmdB family metallophosphoesterase [Deltaproteobacteria bacterium]|jgi:metallophosphoesterase (TIGR00282 family)|nr:YmdB family metallophosphoesterase [Deltaproteobacteria bacterium]
MIRVLFLGDIFGRVGRRLVQERLPELREREKIDVALANAENASGGLGLNAKNARELLKCGLDGLTGGNHSYKSSDLADVFADDHRLVRPANFPDPCPGRGWTILTSPSGVKVGLGNVMGRVHIGLPLGCPFRAASSLIESMTAAGANITVIDFHAEATAEKRALAEHLDGKLGALVGTHTHVQTNDAQILKNGLAFITDLGMTGPHDSVIGLKADLAVAYFTTGNGLGFKAAVDDPVLEGAIVDFRDDGSAAAIRTIRTR